MSFIKIIYILCSFFSCCSKCTGIFQNLDYEDLLFVFLIKYKVPNNDLLACFYFWNYRTVDECLKFVLENTCKRLGERVLREGCIVGESGSTKVLQDTG